MAHLPPQPQPYTVNTVLMLLLLLLLHKYSVTLSMLKHQTSTPASLIAAMKAKPIPSCLNCGCHHPKYVGFLLRGTFGQRNCVPPSSISSSSVAQNDGPGDDGVHVSRGWNKPQYEGRKLWFCIECAMKESSLTDKNGIVLGFLTRRQSDNYTKHAQRMMQLRRDGYIIK